MCLPGLSRYGVRIAGGRSNYLPRMLWEMLVAQPSQEQRDAGGKAHGLGERRGCWSGDDKRLVLARYPSF